MEMKISIQHWRFEDGKTSPNPGSQWKIDPPPCGWYCWIYPENDREFERWMNKNCPTAECTHRFNSGNPMYTVYIKDSQEAIIFQLRWM